MLTQASAVWALPRGASDARAIRIAGKAFLCLSAAMAIAWSAELCRDSWVQHGHRAIMVLVVLGSLAWCFQVGRLWRAWSAVKPALHLQWTGATAEQAHWRVVEWDQAVSVRLVCDFQKWILLEVKSNPVPGQAAQSVWSWVKGRDEAELESDSSVVTTHRLRALLYQTKGDVVQAMAGPDGPVPEQATGRRSLASWRRTTSPGNNLARFAPSRSNHRRQASAASADVAKAEPWPATEFQQTQWLPRAEDDDEGALPSGTLPSGEAR